MRWGDKSPLCPEGVAAQLPVHPHFSRCLSVLSLTLSSMLFDKVVGPGIIDTHVHMNEPGGSREGWESMAGATSAAARGGVTLVVDMPLNSDPVTVTARDVKNKLKVAGRKGGGVSVQVGVWGGAYRIGPGCFERGTSHQLANSPSHQIANSPSHRLANSPSQGSCRKTRARRARSVR